MNNYLEKNKNLKIEFLKTIDISDNSSSDEPSIEIILNSKSNKILKKILQDEPQFDTEKFIDFFIKKAIEEAVKDYEDKP